MIYIFSEQHRIPLPREYIFFVPRCRRNRPHPPRIPRTQRPPFSGPLPGCGGRASTSDAPRARRITTAGSAGFRSADTPRRGTATCRECMPGFFIRLQRDLYYFRGMLYHSRTAMVANHLMRRSSGRSIESFPLATCTRRYNSTEGVNWLIPMLQGERFAPLDRRMPGSSYGSIAPLLFSYADFSLLIRFKSMRA